jgi:hypothetical protein
VGSVLKEGRICEKFCGAEFYKTFDLSNIDLSLQELPGFNSSWQPTFEKIVLSNTKSAGLKILHLTDIHLDLNYT